MLINEVQKLSAIGIHIPVKIRDLSDKAMEFVSQARSLEQVPLITDMYLKQKSISLPDTRMTLQIANFHNTIGDRIIPSQKPMLLYTAQELDGLINTQQDVTWSNTEAVDKYIRKLQNVVERLSKESNKLAFYHNQIREKVINSISLTHILW